MDRFRACLERLVTLFEGRKKPVARGLCEKVDDLESSISVIRMGAQVESPGIMDGRNTFVGESGRFVFISPDIEQDLASDCHKHNIFITGCTNGRYYLLNGLQNAYIDDCTGTFIFVGPCHSTLFIRNCRNVQVRAISQQIRIQNCQDVQIEAIVGVRPVLEGSRNITLSALSIFIYDDLLQQMHRASINALDNQIFQTYDFTPQKRPNFQNSSALQDIDPEWGSLLHHNQLTLQQPQIILPPKMAIKSSMIKKVFTKAYIDGQPGCIGIFYSQMEQQQVIRRLGTLKNNCQVNEIVCQLDDRLCSDLLLRSSTADIKSKKKYLFLLIKIGKGREKEMASTITDTAVISEIISNL